MLLSSFLKFTHLSVVECVTQMVLNSSPTNVTLSQDGGCRGPHCSLLAAMMPAMVMALAYDSLIDIIL